MHKFQGSPVGGWYNLWPPNSLHIIIINWLNNGLKGESPKHLAYKVTWTKQPYSKPSRATGTALLSKHLDGNAAFLERNVTCLGRNAKWCHGSCCWPIIRQTYEFWGIHYRCDSVTYNNFFRKYDADYVMRRLDVRLSWKSRSKS